MNLEQMLIKAEKVSEDFLICEFTDGFAVGYQKNKGNVDSIVSSFDSWGYPPYINCTMFDHGHTLKIKDKNLEKLRAYNTGTGEWIKRNNSQIQDLYSRIVGSLEITPHSSVSWGDVAFGVGAIVGWPVYAPILLGYGILKMMFGDYSYCSPGVGALMIAGPVVGWTMIKGNLENPSVTDYTIDNLKKLKKDEAENPFVKIDRWGNLKIITPQGFTIYSNNQQKLECIRPTKNRFSYDLGDRRYALGLDSTTKDELTRAIETHATLEERRERFNEIIRASKDEQIELLHKLGFIKCWSAWGIYD